MHPNVHCSTLYNSQVMETTHMSTNGGMDTDVVHLHSGMSLDHGNTQHHLQQPRWTSGLSY